LINPSQNDEKHKTFLFFLETDFKDRDANGKGGTILFTVVCSQGSRDVFRHPV